MSCSHCLASSWKCCDMSSWISVSESSSEVSESSSGSSSLQLRSSTCVSGRSSSSSTQSLLGRWLVRSTMLERARLIGVLWWMAWPESPEPPMAGGVSACMRGVRRINDAPGN
ncbi:hypothetical protein [Crucivirus-506]|nr:hypothetical protein [Crucivirus-505]QMW68992.1 hypothetical protein [Crucivirus-506]